MRYLSEHCCEPRDKVPRPSASKVQHCAVWPTNRLFPPGPLVIRPMPSHFMGPSTKMGRSGVPRIGLRVPPPKATNIPARALAAATMPLRPRCAKRFSVKTSVPLRPPPLPSHSSSLYTFCRSTISTHQQTIQAIAGSRKFLHTSDSPTTTTTRDAGFATESTDLATLCI